MTCTLCGQSPNGAAEISLHGEVTCTRHTTVGRCVFCTRPYAEDRPAGWRSFGSVQYRCPTCCRDAVEDQRQARAYLPEVRDAMARLGIELNPRVRARVVDPAEIAEHNLSTGVLLALTDEWTRDEGVQNAIRLVAGLPATLFGRAAAHEMVHVWLAQRGAKLEKSLEEGLCELFAFAYLKRHRSVYADALRHQMKINPDPLYGQGFRTVQQAVREHGLAEVVAVLLRDGRLP